MFINFSWSFWPSCPFYWRQKLTNYRRFYIFDIFQKISYIFMQFIFESDKTPNHVPTPLNQNSFFHTQCKRIFSHLQRLYCSLWLQKRHTHQSPHKDAEMQISYIILLTKINRDVVIGQNSNYTVSFCVKYKQTDSSVTQHTPTEHNIAIMHEVFLKLYDRYRMLLQLGYITGHQVNENSRIGNCFRIHYHLVILNLGPSAPPPQKKEKEFVIKM